MPVQPIHIYIYIYILIHVGCSVTKSERVCSSISKKRML